MTFLIAAFQKRLAAIGRPQLSPRALSHLLTPTVPCGLVEINRWKASHLVKSSLVLVICLIEH